MIKVVKNYTQEFLGITAIIMGVFVYFMLRTNWQPAWISGIDAHDLNNRYLVSLIRDNSPSLFHVLGFSLLTAGILPPAKWKYVIVCGFWLTINMLFELLQSNVVFDCLNSLTKDHNNSILNWAKNYSLTAVFDLNDIISLLSGSVLAYFILIITTKKEDI